MHPQNIHQENPDFKYSPNGAKRGQKWLPLIESGVAPIRETLGNVLAFWKFQDNPLEKQGILDFEGL